ncbi:MAG: hypothetical protein HOC10_07455 [Pelagibacteraceae bacterium]|nr:hypothetical protein [Pelagibacteraceae bacterium]
MTLRLTSNNLHAVNKDTNRPKLALLIGSLPVQFGIAVRVKPAITTLI